MTLFYIYKNLSDDEIREYIAFASSLPGVIFHHSTLNGYKNATIECGYKFGRILAEILRKSEGKMDL